MTRCDDLGQLHLGQFNWSTVTNLLHPGALEQTVRDVTAVAQNPITGAVKSVEFWTAYSPPKRYSGAELDAIYRDQTPNPFLQLIQPTIVIDSVLGKRTIAPYGEADPNAWQENTKRLKIGATAAVGFTVVGLLVLGAALGRIRSKA